MNFFVDGRGYSGTVCAFDKPTLVAEIEQDPEASATSLKLYTGTPSMDCSLKFSAYDRDVLALFGVIEGSDVSVCLTEPYSKRNRHPRSYRLRGHVTRITCSQDSTENLTPLILDLSLVLFQELRGAHVVHTIDSLAQAFQFCPWKENMAQP